MEIINMELWNSFIIIIFYNSKFNSICGDIKRFKKNSLYIDCSSDFFFAWARPSTPRSKKYCTANPIDRCHW